MNTLETLVESLVNLASYYLVGSTLILGAGLVAMAVSRTLIERKRFATTTVVVLLGWFSLGILPMDRPLSVLAQPEEMPTTDLASAPEPPTEDPRIDESPVAAPADAAAADSEKTSPDPIDAQADVQNEIEDPGLTTAEMTLVALGSGSLLSGVYLVLAWLTLRRRVSRAREASPCVMALARESGSTPKRLRILITDDPTRPYCFGLRRPTIVVPADLCRPECRERLRAVLLHELSHIADRDLRDQVLLAACLPLFYWHPLFWMLRGRLRLTSELLADERAAQQVDRKTYVRELIGLVDHRNRPLPLAPVLPVMGLESEFYRRMNMLLNRRRPLTTRCSTIHTILRRGGAFIALTAMSLSWGLPALSAQEVDATRSQDVKRSIQDGGKQTRPVPGWKTYRYKIKGKYPSPKHLEKMLMVIEKHGFTMTGLRVAGGDKSKPGRFFATVSQDVPKKGQVERLLVKMLDMRNELHRMGITIDHLGPHVGRDVDLLTGKDALDSQYATVRAIVQGRTSWTKTLDELITVISNDSKPERHRAWMRSMMIRGSSDDKKGPSVVLPGAVAGGDIRLIANLHDDVKRAPFFSRIKDYTPPSGVKKIDEDLSPRESFTFSWKWQFQTPGWNQASSRPDGETISGGAVSLQQLRHRYRELVALAGVLPSVGELSGFMRSMQGRATRSDVSIDRFVPIRRDSQGGPLQRIGYQYYFRASLWQLMELMSFVENQDHLWNIRDLTLSRGREDDGLHSCRMTIETFVLKPDEELEARFGSGDVSPERLAPNYKFGGRKGRRDIFVDPRPAAKPDK